MRDSQRQHLYNAENEVFCGSDHKGYLDRKACYRLAYMVVRSREAREVNKKLDPRRTRFIIRFVPKRSIASTFSGSFYRRPYIILPPWAMTPNVVIHEATHIVLPFEGHGPLFARMYATFVQKFIGEEQYTQLRKAYVKHRVRVMRV